MNNNILKKTAAQLKREFLEYRWGLLYIPALLSVIVTVSAAAFAYYWLYLRNEPLSQDFTINSGAMEFMYSNCSLVMFFYFFILANYLSSCLYDDRKSKQILFWKSMPVSETMNVLVKILVVTLLAPTLLLFINLVMSLVGIILVYLLTSGLTGDQVPYSVSGEGNLLWVNMEIYRDNLLGMLFLAPIIGYLLAVSAWVKRFPLAIAFGVPMLLIFADFLLGRFDLTLGLMPLVMEYGSLWLEIKEVFILGEVFEFKLTYLAPLLISVTIGGLFVFLSVWLRNNRHEI